MQVVGPDVAAGHAPQIVVEAGVWQSARPLGRYALVGATVTPAFTFEGFELRVRAEPWPGAAPSARQGVLAGRARGGHMSETQEQGLSALLHETRTFPPPEDLAKEANAQPGIYAEAQADPARLLGGAGRGG